MFLAQLRPFMFVGFAIMVGSGILLFWSHAADCYNSVYFRFKIGLQCQSKTGVDTRGLS